MSDISQLPPSAHRLFKKPTQVSLNSINTPSQQFTGKETWQVLQSESLAFLRVVYGFPEVVGGLNGLATRRVPLRHPEYPFALATSCTATGKGWDPSLTGTTGTATNNTHPNGFWKYMDIEVNFQTPVYPLSGNNAFLSFSGSSSSRQIAGVASGFLLNGNAPTFDPGEEIMGEDFQAVTHQLPTLPMAVYDGVRDCVNNSIFTGPNGQTRPVGTVLYRGPAYTQTNNFDGNNTWEVTHQFSYSRIPWNFYFIAGVQYELTRDDGSRKHPLADLTAIFNA